MLAPTLDRLSQTVHLFPHVRKDQVHTGDWIIIHTVASTYTLHAVGNGLFDASGGWFDKKGFSPMRIGVSGATWGGSSIMPKVLAACGMRVEFRNRMITSPVKSILVIPARLGN
jgi:hypothetical protein